MAISTIFLWLVTERSLRHAKADARRQAREQRVSLRISARAANASRKAAEAADRSAKAALRVEVPYLHVEYGGSNLDPPAVFAEYPEWIKAFSPRVKFTNYGRTPAFIYDWIITAEIGGRLPDDPPIYVQKKTVCYPIVADKGVQMTLTEDIFDGKDVFTDDKIRAVLDESQWLYIHGIIRFRDFMDTPHEKGFVWLWLCKPSAVYTNWGPLLPKYAKQT